MMWQEYHGSCLQPRDVQSRYSKVQAQRHCSKCSTVARLGYPAEVSWTGGIWRGAPCGFVSIGSAARPCTSSLPPNWGSSAPVLLSLLRNLLRSLQYQ